MRALNRSLRRSLAMTSAGALLLTVAPGVASAQTQPEARTTDNVCGPLASYGDRFDDIEGSAHERNVLCMEDYDLTEGTRASGGESYAPRDEVTRGQMASFIARFIREYDGRTLPVGPAERFDDVEAPFVHTQNINDLANVGIVAGTNASGGDLYNPQGSVDRGQTAALISRALSWIDDGDASNDSVPPAGSDDFPDVDSTYVHFGDINAVAGVGIVQGFDDGDYRPRNPVLRDQMASFVMRAFSYAVEFDLGVDDEVPPPVDGPTIIDSSVDTDVFDTEGDTGTASVGDQWTLTFDGEVDTVVLDVDGTDTGASFIVDDGTDTDSEYTVQCLLEDAPSDGVGEGNFAAECELSEDGESITITLLEDLVNEDDEIASYPLTITGTDVTVDGDDVDFEAEDGEFDLELDDDTQTLPLP